MRVGSLDEPSRITSDIQICTSTQEPWVGLPDGVPAAPEFYKPADVRSADSIARIKAARAE